MLTLRNFCVCLTMCFAELCCAVICCSGLVFPIFICVALCCAELNCAERCCAVLCCAVLCCAVLCCAMSPRSCASVRSPVQITVHWVCLCFTLPSSVLVFISHKCLLLPRQARSSRPKQPQAESLQLLSMYFLCSALFYLFCSALFSDTAAAASYLHTCLLPNTVTIA